MPASQVLVTLIGWMFHFGFNPLYLKNIALMYPVQDTLKPIRHRTGR